MFVDIEPYTYCVDVNLIEEQINENTVAMAPNLMGNLCNWPEIRKIADKHNLIVIEDSADTLGARSMIKNLVFHRYVHHKFLWFVLSTALVMEELLQ